MADPVFRSTGQPTPRGAERSKPSERYLRTFESGEYVFREGDLGTEMYILQEGEVEILKRVNDVEERLAGLGKGDFFGEMAVLEDLPRTASARAATDCTAIEIDGSTFDQMLRTKPEIAVRIMRKLSRRLRQTDAMLQEALGAEEAQAPEMPLPERPVSEERASERLVHPDSGTEFRLSQSSETTIGRHDPVTGIDPDVDLSEVDEKRSTSRRHAKIYRRGDKFFLVEEIGTMNGTYVDGEALETGVPRQIEPGNELQFGLVELEFRVP